MDHNFWLERWQRREIGFHVDRPQPALVAHWAALGIAPGGRVFVPLAGKSLDMAWLADAGYGVAGVELSPLAVGEFFAGRGDAPEISRRHGFEISRKGPIEIWCGDYFALTRDLIGRLDAFYDRAALVAMPPRMQGRYADQLAALMPAGAAGLLVGLDYDIAEMDGPPFALPRPRIFELFGSQFDIELLEARDGLTTSQHLAKKGVTRLEEASYRLRRRA